MTNLQLINLLMFLQKAKTIAGIISTLGNEAELKGYLSEFSHECDEMAGPIKNEILCRMAGIEHD